MYRQFPVNRYYYVHLEHRPQATIYRIDGVHYCERLSLFPKIF